MKRRSKSTPSASPPDPTRPAKHSLQSSSASQRHTSTPSPHPPSSSARRAATAPAKTLTHCLQLLTLLPPKNKHSDPTTILRDTPLDVILPSAEATQSASLLATKTLPNPPSRHIHVSTSATPLAIRQGVLRTQGEELVELVRQACFYGREKGIAEARVQLQKGKTHQSQKSRGSLALEKPLYG